MTRLPFLRLSPGVQVFPLLALLGLLPLLAAAQTRPVASTDTLCAHKKLLDRQGGLLAWHQPQTPGAAYGHVMKLASEFLLNDTPTDPATGLKLYYISCCFDGPHMRPKADFEAGKTWENWMNNPACTFAGLTQSLAMDYYAFTGDRRYVDLLRAMLRYQLANGTTPADFKWANVPYASADPGSKTYFGATRWENEGMRGDGLHGIEPDKIGEMGVAYLRFYQITQEDTFLLAATHCADALATHVRDVSGPPSPFDATQASRSPWPFRLNARTGRIWDDYTSNVIEPIRLFDELLRTPAAYKLPEAKTKAYQRARKLAWDWLYSRNGPIKTSVWNNYFEDIPNDSLHSNRTQITPLETARYLLKNPSLDKELDVTVPSLIHYVRSAFATDGLPAIKEQTWCYEPMGSHTARYASLCALWYERTGDARYKEEAYRHFNYATYMTDPNGVVRVGHTWPGTWFSDGYGDYIKHFMEGLGAVPEWAPAGENHLLRSTSVVQDIAYQARQVRYKTFDAAGTEVLRLAAKPKSVTAGGKALALRTALAADGFTWQPLGRGGVLRVRRTGAQSVEIKF